MRISCPPFDPVHCDDPDLLDSAFYAHGDPHALWARLRAENPVYRCDPGDGREPFWVVTRHQDVSRVLRDYETFSSRRGTMLCIVDLSMPDIASDDMMPDTDPPRHRQLREPLNRALTPRAVSEQKEPIREIVRSVLRPALDGRTIDIAQEALMFPMAFTGTLMGLPQEHWPRMAELTTRTIAYDDPDYSTGSPTSTVRQAHHELFEFFREEISRRVPTDPGTDLIGILRSMELDEGPLSERQLILNCYALLLGANVTTPHALSTMVALMGEHPEQFRMAREDPGLRAGCVREVLRWSSPASHFMRYATRDVDLGGGTIRTDEPVSVWLGSANRDERAFDDPYRFDITRHPNRHLAFGIGPHYCIGAGLAQLGLRVFLDELLDLVAEVEPAGEVAHLASNFVAGYKSMPVRLVPRHRNAPTVVGSE
ncbi:cytochrome P450 [Haloactinospora alba]|uniref:Cytochrome P450 n=1 Tax=Haloactinospora alba TaxID=405555 RepID=A0A543N962_9ACTN|nr:cytochrome P450 [Haloactinospora alba]TQN28376.1 cytochrome P450 [Haloactinospora alba]